MTTAMSSTMEIMNFSTTIIAPTSMDSATNFSTTASIPNELQTQIIFFQTAAARGISGFFVIMALLITCHQVTFSSKTRPF